VSVEEEGTSIVVSKKNVRKGKWGNNRRVKNCKDLCKLSRRDTERSTTEKEFLNEGEGTFSKNSTRRKEKPKSFVGARRIDRRDRDSAAERRNCVWGEKRHFELVMTGTS